MTQSSEIDNTAGQYLEFMIHGFMNGLITLQELEQDYGITTEGLARAMETHVRGWLCEVDGSVAGFSMGDASNGEVQVVAVHPGFENLGIGHV